MNIHHIFNTQRSENTSILLIYSFCALYFEIENIFHNIAIYDLGKYYEKKCNCFDCFLLSLFCIKEIKIKCVKIKNVTKKN